MREVGGRGGRAIEETGAVVAQAQQYIAEGHGWSVDVLPDAAVGVCRHTLVEIFWRERDNVPIVSFSNAPRELGIADAVPGFGSGFGFPYAISRRTASRTPLTNCTESSPENLRANSDRKSVV